MRSRLVKHQFVTVRPLNPQTADEFGDAPIVVANNRDGSFRMKMQITMTAGSRYDSGKPGRSLDIRATAIVRQRDIPPTAPDGWKPDGTDIFELANGDKLFVVDVQDALPKRVSIRNADGGFSGWRVTLSDKYPAMSAASQYE